MLFSSNRKAQAESPVPPPRDDGFPRLVSEHAFGIGREAAELRGALEDMQVLAKAQVESLTRLTSELDVVMQAQATIEEETRASVQSVAEASQTVQGVAAEVVETVQCLRHVLDAASEITRISLQTRLVAFNASVEAKRAGEAGRGFAVVADAVKELAAQVEASSKAITGTVGNLEGRVHLLVRELQAGPDNEQGSVHRALRQVDTHVARMQAAASKSHALCGGASERAGECVREVEHSGTALERTITRTETFLRAAEDLIVRSESSGHETPVTPYVRAAQEAAARISAAFEAALADGVIDPEGLFDERYQPMVGTDPQQHMTRFCGLTDRVVPPVADPLLQSLDKIAMATVADRNGYCPTHHAHCSQPQRPGQSVWNAQHCRNRRMYRDRNSLAAAANQLPFLVQTYRRNLGGGQFEVLKEVDAPIFVGSRHWGTFRLAFRF